MPQQSQLYHLVQLWVELTRQLHKTVAPDVQAQFGSRTHLLLIGAAVFLGTIEGRPLTATKLAAFVGMPRATVIRRLRTLCRRGAIERSGDVYRMPDKRLDRLARCDFAKLAKLVRSTSEKLSRPETSRRTR